MAEFINHEEGHDMFASKNVGRAALTTGIIGTSLGVLNMLGNNNGCGCGYNNGGILGGLFGNRNNCNCCCDAKLMAMAQGQAAENLAWSNRIKSMEDDANLYTVVDGRINRTNEKLDSETQLLTNQMYQGRIEDLKEKFDIYARGVERDNATNARICAAENAGKDDKFFLYTQTVQGDAAVDAKFTKMNYEGRIQDLNEKFDLYTRLNNKITDLEKAQAKTETALPLMFELSKVNSERYTDACCCTSQKNLLVATNDLQRQLDHKIDGQIKYAYSDLCAPVPSISPLYCSPFTPNGSGTTWAGCCNSGCQNL